MREHPLLMAGIGIVSSRWDPTIVIGGKTMTTSAKGSSPNRTAIQTSTVGQLPGTMATNDTVGLVIKASSQKGITPGSMKLDLVVNATWECSVMSDLEEHLEEEVAPVTASPKN